MFEVVCCYGVFLIEDDWVYDFGIDIELCFVVVFDDDGYVVYLCLLIKSVFFVLCVVVVIVCGLVCDWIFVDWVVELMYVSGLL